MRIQLDAGLWLIGEGRDLVLLSAEGECEKRITIPRAAAPTLYAALADYLNVDDDLARNP